MNLFNIDTQIDEKYTKKVNRPQYLPSNTKPNIQELYNSIKSDSLIYKIKKANITEDEKNFLIQASKRHLVFNYGKIADYYAHATKEMQELMEESALVILDINDAISNGYVKLSKNIEKIMEESGRKANDKK